ncbi:MAG TPA: nitroreductase family protein [Clostridia bacterium]|nr:nitroreductase family protein [Clostridia bacterium]
MNKLEILEKRKSCRNYKNKELVAEDKRNIRSLLEAPHPLGNIPEYELVFVDDGKRSAIKLEGFAGYSGVMIEAPHYIAVFSESDPANVRKTAYAVEDIILRMIAMDIGSCWITVLDSYAAKIAMGWKNKGDLIALIALGYPQEDNYFSRLLSNLKHPLTNPLKEGYGGLNFETKSGLPLREETSSFVYLDHWGNSTDHYELERRGLDRVYNYLKYAPSWGNRQPWKFIVDHDDIVLCIHKNPKVSEIDENLDGGIAMYYFELAMTEHGLRGKWDFDALDKDYGIPQDYWTAGRFKL